MKNTLPRLDNILFWLPRVLGILFILFLAIFALDVFVPGQTAGYYFVALLIHLIPNFILAGILLISWKHEVVGGSLFIIIALIFTVFFRTYTMLASFMLVTLPTFLIGVLFLLHYFISKYWKTSFSKY